IVPVASISNSIPGSTLMPVSYHGVLASMMNCLSRPGFGLGVTLGSGLGVTLGSGLGVTLGSGLGVTLGSGLGVTLGSGLGVTPGSGLGSIDGFVLICQ